MQHLPTTIARDHKARAERMLLGCLLREPYNLPDHVGRLSPLALQNAEAGLSTVFAEILKQYAERGTYSVATIYERTHYKALADFASECTEVDLAWAVDNWWQQYAIWAELEAQAAATSQDVITSGADAMRAKVDEVRERLGANGTPVQASPTDSFLKLALDKLEGLEPSYKTTMPLREVAGIFRAFKPQYLTIIAGRPGMGKTQFALNMYSHFLDMGASGLFFSLEMSCEDLLSRLLGIRHGINPDADWSTLDKRMVGSAITEVASLRHKLIGDVFAIEQIESICASEYYRGTLDYIMVDYIQLIKLAARSKDKNTEVTAISSALVRMSKRFNCPVIALSQLSRDNEKRGGSKRPFLSDLRDSGSLEQDAANIIFLHRPEYYGIMEDEEGLPTAGIGEVIIAKHRNGRTGSARCAWNPIRGYTDIEAAPFSPKTPQAQHSPDHFIEPNFSSARPAADVDIPF